jgi:uncharacterized circularly permuted ATP-grasp superfamily protein
MDSNTLLSLSKSELSWIEQEIVRETRALELFLGELYDKERRAIRKNVVSRCLKTLRKEKGIDHG